MYTGLLHSHIGVAYLLFLVALANAVFALAGARTGGALTNALKWSHNIGMMGLGRLNIVLGLGLAFLNTAWLGEWWAWAAIFLWAPAEVAAKRFVKPELQAALDGGNASGRLVTGTVIQLVVIVAIFGLMSARP